MTDLTKNLTLGLDSFGDVSRGADGQFLPMDQVLRDVVAQGVLADQVGVDFLGLGEHHREDFALSSPEIALAAIAGQTQRIHLGTAVTVLSSDDPVRLFQRFSTLNAISNGRAEVIVGRGSFTESFPLFGYEMNDYEVLFEEKLDLFTRLVKEKEVSWKGQTRTGLRKQVVYPPLGPQGLTTWVGVGGSPDSVIRVARQDLQMMLAIIGGDPARFVPYVDLYHRAVAQMDGVSRPIGIHSPGFVAETDEAAREILWPHYAENFGRIGRERGWSAMSKQHYLNEIESGSLYVGSPETVAKKMAKTIKLLGIERFDLKYVTGPVPHQDLMNCIRLYGEKVMPMVRDILASDKA